MPRRDQQAGTPHGPPRPDRHGPSARQSALRGPRLPGAHGLPGARAAPGLEPLRLLCPGGGCASRREPRRRVPPALPELCPQHHPRLDRRRGARGSRHPPLRPHRHHDPPRRDGRARLRADHQGALSRHSGRAPRRQLGRSHPPQGDRPPELDRSGVHLARGRQDLPRHHQVRRRSPQHRSRHGNRRRAGDRAHRELGALLFVLSSRPLRRAHASEPTRDGGRGERDAEAPPDAGAPEDPSRRDLRGRPPALHHLSPVLLALLALLPLLALLALLACWPCWPC